MEKVIGYSEFYKATYNNEVFILKTVTKRRNKVCVWNSKFQILKRILNELFAADVYKHVFGIKTFDYFIYQNEDKEIYIGSKA